MLFSVIIPCHNAGRWIQKALESVENQAHPAHEIIVIDDGSIDDSLARIKNCGVPVKLLQVSFQNAAAARNAGIEIATGDWIALLDADDIWYPNHLARAAELLEATDDVAFMSNHDWIGLDGEIIPIPAGLRCKHFAPKVGLTIRDFFAHLNGSSHFGHSTVLYRRDRLFEVGMFDISQKRRHDIDLWLRVIAGPTWAYDTVKSAGYREGVPGSISKDELDCDYYYLRALMKNLPLVDFPEAKQCVAIQSRRAMGIAFVDGAAEHYDRIREMAWPHLPVTLKFAYACGSACPSLLRKVIEAKRCFQRRLSALRTGSEPDAMAN